MLSWIPAWTVTAQDGLAEPLAASAAPPVESQFSFFRDDLADGQPCQQCPLMVMIPAGTFMMGSPADESGRHGNEGPQHSVTIGRPFALGVYEVTFEQWDACVAAGACRDTGADEGWGRGTRPAINLAWSDAVEYVAYLSAITRRQYRLPSEAEWEYAARAGTLSPYFWGDAKGSGHAVCESCGSEWDNRSTAPVGSFPPNALGLHDMLGNAWEWTADCWNLDYSGAPADGSAWHGGDCAARVLRGGAWFSFPYNIRSATRMRGVIDNRYLSKGLRVALSL